MADSTPTTSIAPSRESQAPLVSPEQLPGELLSATEERTRKRDFFRFGKKDDDKQKTKSATAGPPQNLSGRGLLPSLSGARSPGSTDRQGNHPYESTSPRGMRSPSPRTHSPASSMIFERDVQEDVSGIPAEATAQIPSHIMTENHIPPALDATSEAITDKRLDPDSVEIVTHSAHQPAADRRLEGHHETAPTSPVLSNENIHHTHVSIPRSDPSPFPSDTIAPTASNPTYANLESVDVRRLSFISFADVVHGEHDSQAHESRRDSAAVTSHPSIHLPPPGRSPSPMRSPVSSSAQMGTSPPTSVSPSMHESSPHRSQVLGDLNIETMRQALRKTGSGDMSGYRTAPMSPAAGPTEHGS